MARIRSLITQTEIDEAGRAHNCQRISSHRIRQGEKRLKVRNGRSWDHYCLVCAKTILERDIERLKELARQVESELGSGTH